MEKSHLEASLPDAKLYAFKSYPMMVLDEHEQANANQLAETDGVADNANADADVEAAVATDDATAASADEQRPASAVRGAVVWLKPEFFEARLPALDDLEDYDPANEASSLYLRVRRTARLHRDGAADELVECWTYVGLPRAVARLPRVSGDCWREWVATRPEANAFWARQRSGDEVRQHAEEH